VTRPTSSTRGAPAGGFGEYRRRNLLPAVLIVVVLVVAGIVTWTVVLTNSSSSETTACNLPPGRGGTLLPRTTLDSTEAAAPGDVRVTVFNGAGQRGQAQLAAVELGELGIAEAAPPDNDPLFPAQDLTCVGQIRYGPSGAAAARTLSLVVPCAELVEDGRPTDDVGLALGSDFREATPGQGVTDALRGLSRAASDGAPVAGTDPATLSALRDVDCSS